MKAIITNDLKNRVKYAAMNGSVIAKDLLAAINACREIAQETDKTMNYFDSKRKVQTRDDRKVIRVVVTCCRKDLTNRNLPDYGNPQAPYFPENRSEVSVKDFACVFKAVREKEYDDTDWTYFDSAMRLPSKVTFRVGTTMSDFIKAYDASNYIGLSESDQSTLHGSCMRNSDTARNAADYYVNFAGAKILIGETSDGEVVSRAILWDNMTVNGAVETINFIDRTYTAFDGFLISAMRRMAVEYGYVWRKSYNDYSHKRQFTPMATDPLTKTADGSTFVAAVGVDTDFTVYKKVPSLKLHKRGCPYCDTMSHLYYDDTDYQMTICNSDSMERELGSRTACLANTGGYASQRGYICPVCGKWHSDYSADSLCNECEKDFFEETIFGRIVKGKLATYKGKSVPASMLLKGKPTPAFNAYIALQRICNYEFPL